MKDKAEKLKSFAKELKDAKNSNINLYILLDIAIRILQDSYKAHFRANELTKTELFEVNQEVNSILE